MKNFAVKDLAKLFLVGVLLYGVNVCIIDNYLSPLWLSLYFLDSPFRTLAVFLVGVLLARLLMGRAAAQTWKRLCLGAGAAAGALSLLRFLLAQAARLLRDVSFIGGVTWSYVLAFVLPIWLYGALFGLALRFAWGEGAAERRPAVWRVLWFCLCVAVAALYQRSVEFVPHTRLMAYQTELSLLVFQLAPLLGIFFETLCFRMRCRIETA